MQHPVRFNPEFNPELDVRNIVASRAGVNFPASLALLWQGKFLMFNGKYLIWRP